MTNEVIHPRIGTALLVLCVLAVSVSVDAQSTFGSIVGVVHDAIQAVVPGASVKIRRLEDNNTRSTTSDQNGSFEFLNLKPGNDALSVQAEGFAEFQVSFAELTSRQTLAKTFHPTERLRVRFESTFTNVLNHTNFAPPATQIDVPATLGVLSAPQTAENAGNRTGQLALRVEF